MVIVQTATSMRSSQLNDNWLSTNGLTKWPRNRWTVPIGHDDYKVLKAWRTSNDKRKWQRAVALLDLHPHCTMASICRKLERSPKTIKKWRRMFLTQGARQPRSPVEEVRQQRTSGEASERSARSWGRSEDPSPRVDAMPEHLRAVTDRPGGRNCKTTQWRAGGATQGVARQRRQPAPRSAIDQEALEDRNLEHGVLPTRSLRGSVARGSQARG
jgi:hypothetical protein